MVWGRLISRSMAVATVVSVFLACGGLEELEEVGGESDATADTACEWCDRKIVVKAVSLTEPDFTTEYVTDWISGIWSSPCVTVKRWGEIAEPEYVLSARFEKAVDGRFEYLSWRGNFRSPFGGGESLRRSTMVLGLFCIYGSAAPPRGAFGAGPVSVENFTSYVKSWDTGDTGMSLEPHKLMMEEQLGGDAPIENVLWDFEQTPATCRITLPNEPVKPGQKVDIVISDFKDRRGRECEAKLINRLLVKVDRGDVLNRDFHTSEYDEDLKVFLHDRLTQQKAVVEYMAPNKPCSEDRIQVFNSCCILDHVSVRPLSKTETKDEIAAERIEIACPKWAWVGTLEMEQSWRFSCETTRQNANDSQTLKQYDLTKIMVSMELEIDDIRVAEEGVDAKNEADIEMSGTVTGLMTNSKDVWSRGSDGWTHTKDTARGNGTCGVGASDKERMSIALTGGALAGGDQIRSLMDEMRSTTDPNRIAELNDQLLALMEPDAESGSLPLKIIVQYAPECPYKLTNRHFAERQDKKGHRIDDDRTWHLDVNVGGIQIPGSEFPFTGTYEKDDDGVERIHGEFSRVVDRSPSGTSFDCPEGILFQSAELNLERRRVR